MGESQAGVHWIRCAGCGGEVGVPPEMLAAQIACPKCGGSIVTSKTILYRPAAPAATGPKLDSAADRAIIYGALSVVLGWTIIVPGLAASWWGEAANLADRQGVRVPLRATLGLILGLGFGVVQAIAFLPRLFDYLGK